MANESSARARTLSIDGMHCDGCVRRVGAVLRKVPDVIIEEVRIGGARVAVPPSTSDDGPDGTGARTAAIQAAVIEALESAGYRARWERP